MSKKILHFDSYCGYDVFAASEDGRLSEFSCELKNRTSIVGNVYKGRVASVLSGMQAAFIDCGLEKNCYLSLEEIYPDELRYDGKNGLPARLPELKEGNEILVQVKKPPVGKKGAKVTAFPSLIGNYVIYMPNVSFVGVSRKIADAELRKNLIHSAEQFLSDGEGLVFRTAAPYARPERIESEFIYLKNLYAKILSSFKDAETGRLLYTDPELPVRTIRDTLNTEVEKIIAGNTELYALLSEQMSLYPESSRKPVELFDLPGDMLDATGLGEQIFKIAEPKADIGNGAYLVIEQTEALTSIDVNTGAYTGDDSLEQTVYSVNLAAAREIARQVKLRNIGGIIVVDFIDMTNPAHNAALVAELEKELKKDAAKCEIAPMSEFGLVEFTRKRTGVNPAVTMTKPCKCCRSGYVKATDFALLALRAKILNMYAGGVKNIRADLSPELFERAHSWKEFKDDLYKRLQSAKLYLVPRRSYAEDRFSCRTAETFSLPADAVRFI